MKNIQFYPAGGGFITTPDKLTEHFEDVDGQLRKLAPIVKSYKTVPDRRDQHTLRIFKSDKDIVMDALSWITNQPLSFSTDKWITNKQHSAEIVEQTGDVLEIPLPGYFEPAFEGPEAVHEICTDFKILGQYFSTYKDIFMIKIGENPVVRSILDFLVESQVRMAEILIERGMGEDLPPLPEWLSRTLSIRKEG